MTIALPELPKDLVEGSALKRLSGRHHKLAQLLAEGMKAGDAGRIAGYCPSRVSVLKADPAFQELIAFYQDAKVDEFRGVQQKLADVTDSALDVLQDKLEDEGDDMTVGQLLEIIKVGADRSGFGPSATSVTVNVDLSERLKAARARISRGVIEGEFEEKK